MSDNHDHHHNHDNNNNLSALLAGALIGAAAIYLFGTEKGRKLKDELLDEGLKLLEKLEGEMDKTQEQIEDSKEKIVETAHKVEEVTEDVVETLTEVPQHIAAVQKKGRKFFFSRSHPHHSVES